MNNETPLSFWHRHIGQKLGPEALGKSVLAPRPQQTKNGVQLKRLGSCGLVVYMASEGDARLISALRMPEPEGLRLIPAGSVHPFKYLAQWMLYEATPPFMVGMIGNSDPALSFTLTQNERLVSFCETDKGFAVDISKVRAAKTALDALGIPWKTGVAIAIHDYQRYRMDPSVRNKEKLQKAFLKFPGLREVLIKTDIRPDSGEYVVLSWLHSELKEKKHDPV